MQKTQSFTEGSIFKALIALSVPVVFSNILQTAYQLTDTYWVGRLGAEAVAAVSLSFPIIFLMFAVGGGLSIAGSILVAQAIGAKDEARANHISAQTLLMMIVVVIPLSAIGYFLAEPIMRLMGAAPDVLPLATSYMQISFLGLVFVFSFFMYQSLMRSVGDVSTPLYIVFGTVILNLFLDPMFIYGFGPFPAMGVSGAALATVITQALASIIGLWMLFSGRYGIHLKLNELKPDLMAMKQMFFLGLPASIEQSMRALGLTVMTILAAGFGTSIVAAYGIGVRVISFVIIPAVGLSMATSTLVAQNIGAQKVKRAEETARLSAILGFVSLTVVGVLFFIFAGPITGAFITGDPVALAASTMFVQIMSLTFGCIGVQMALGGAFQGSGNTFASMVLTVVSQWVLQFPIAFILSHKTSLGVDGLWWAFPVSNVIIAIITVIWFMSGEWKKKDMAQFTDTEKKVIEEAIVEEGINT